jgi:hypothetical protein
MMISTVLNGPHSRTLLAQFSFHSLSRINFHPQILSLVISIGASQI